MKEINFSGPFPLAAIKPDDPFMGSGVYIWAVKQMTGNYRVHYVGQTGRSFYKRTKEHIIHILGGNYGIWDSNAMKKGKLDVVWDGLWRSGTISDLIESFEVVGSAAKSYLSTLDLFLGNVTDDKHLRLHIEKAIVLALRESPETNSLLPSDIRYRASKKNKPDIKLNINCSSDIEGLPGFIEI